MFTYFIFQYVPCMNSIIYIYLLWQVSFQKIYCGSVYVHLHWYRNSWHYFPEVQHQFWGVKSKVPKIYYIKIIRKRVWIMYSLGVWWGPVQLGQLRSYCCQTTASGVSGGDHMHFAAYKESLEGWLGGVYEAWWHSWWCRIFQASTHLGKKLNL